MSSFDTSFERIIGNEGGYVNNPADPGGETSWGISKRSYPDLDIKSLTKDDSKIIYKRDFWDRIKGDELPPSVAFQTFDFAVNSGIETAVRYLQRALGVVDDGVWGPNSKETLQFTPETKLMINLLALRLDYMTRLNAWKTFSLGWARRISKDLLYAAQDL